MATPLDDKLSREQTSELTGADATMDQAEIGDAGNGVDIFGADLTGGPLQPLEDEPDARDIRPDEVKHFLRTLSEKEPKITAQPDELLPIDLSEMP